mgnify:CR=1 FL=1
MVICCTVLPVVSSAMVLKNDTRLFKTVYTAAKTILLMSVPSSLIMTFFSKEILYILFKNTASGIMLDVIIALIPAAVAGVAVIKLSDISQIVDNYMASEGATVLLVNLQNEYVVPKDCVFLMGDNRENSHDSRDYGAIKILQIGNVYLDAGVLGSNSDITVPQSSALFLRESCTIKYL